VKSISDFIPVLYNSPILLISGFIFAFLTTWIGIPAVNRLAKEKNLYDLPGDRSSHSNPVPRLGGAMIFGGVILSSVLFTDLVTASELKYIIAGMLVLFFIGLKDDIVSLTPLKKAIGQILAAFVIIVPGNIRVSCCYGIFGIDEISYIPSVILSLLLVTGLINSINFIDGIDGLASGIGIMASTVFGILFLNYNHFSYAVICFALAGSLLAFFYFNALSRKNKIFLGDTGSMIIGFLLAVFTIYLIEMPSESDNSQKALPISPAMSFAILFIPVFDSIRVSIIRILNGKAIYTADRNHIHHKLLKLTGNHLKATLILITSNILLIILVYLLRSIGNKFIILSLIFLGVIFTVLLGFKIEIKK